MIEVVTRARAPEMAQRYQGTYGFLKTGSGKKILVTINDVDTSSVEVMDVKSNKYTLASDTGCELEFTQVPSQWFQPDPDHIAYVNRRPDRQYKRGICPGNTNVFIPASCGKYLVGADTTAARINALFNPTDPEALRAFSRYSRMKCGLWSKFFAYAQDTVYCKDLVIGTVDHELKVIMLNDNVFAQEMRDALVRSNSDYTVKIKE